MISIWVSSETHGRYNTNALQDDWSVGKLVLVHYYGKAALDNEYKRNEKNTRQEREEDSLLVRCVFIVYSAYLTVILKTKGK